MTTSQINSIPDLGTEFKFRAIQKPKKKRIAPLSVRLSAEQRAKLEQDSVGMSLNAYVLSRLFDDDKPKRKRREPTKRDRAIAKALRRLLILPQ